MALAPAVSPGAAIVPVASSDAHRGVGGRYGGYKALGPNSLGPNSLGPNSLRSKNIGPKSRSLKNIGPGGFDADSKTGAGKQPYPYPYYYDTSRGNYGCNRYARRAIDTDNANWWARYRACIEASGD
jgi:hypothetical protein